MKATTELFDLVKAMNGAEKGYFKKHSAIKTVSDKSYLKLFNSIEEQKEYDEKFLREKFRNEKFARQFPVMKSYLYDRVLTALDSYHDSSYETVRHYLHQAEILFEKGLYKQSLKLIHKAKKKSEQLELYVFIPEILNWEIAIAQEKLDFKKRIILLNEYEKALTVLENIRLYNFLSAQIGMNIRQYGEEKKEKYFRQIKSIMYNPALKNISRAVCFSSQIKFYYLHATINYFKGNLGKTHAFFEKEFSLYETNREKITIHFPSYLACIRNLLGTCFRLKLFDEFEKYLSVLKEASALTKNFSYKTKIFHVYNNFLTDYIISQGQFEDAKKVVSEILKEYETYQSGLNLFEKTFLLVNIAIIWFGAEEYHKCIFYLNKIRNEISTGIFPDAERFLHIFYLLAHLEVEHYDLLPSLAQSSLRLLEKKNNLGEFEKIILSFFAKEFFKADTKQNRTEAFIQLKKEMLSFFSNKKDNYFISFDFDLWVESKIQNQSFGEVVKNKANKSK